MRCAGRDPRRRASRASCVRMRWPRLRCMSASRRRPCLPARLGVLARRFGREQQVPPLDRDLSARARNALRRRRARPSPARSSRGASRSHPAHRTRAIVRRESAPSRTSPPLRRSPRGRSPARRDATESEHAREGLRGPRRSAPLRRTPEPSLPSARAPRTIDPCRAASRAPPSGRRALGTRRDSRVGDGAPCRGRRGPSR